jgi:hypothetical protein
MTHNGEDSDQEVNWGDVSLQSWADRWASGSKQHTANSIAMTLVWVFAATLGSLLIAGVLVLIIAVKQPAGDAEHMIRLLTEYLQAVAGFVSTVFAQLLAFILGHYFGTKKGR